MTVDKSTLIDLTTEIVAAYVANNTLPGDQLSSLIQQVYQSVATLGQAAPVEEAKPQPAVPIRKSIKPNEIICLDCGKGQKMLKRHLLMAHNLSPDEYRAKWGLSPDYPLVAPEYAKLRSQFAKQIGLGRKKEDAPPPVVKGKAQAAQRRGRGRKPAEATE